MKCENKVVHVSWPTVYVRYATVSDSSKVHEQTEPERSQHYCADPSKSGTLVTDRPTLDVLPRNCFPVHCDQQMSQTTDPSLKRELEDPSPRPLVLHIPSGEAWRSYSAKPSKFVVSPLDGDNTTPYRKTSNKTHPRISPIPLE